MEKLAEGKKKNITEIGQWKEVEEESSLMFFMKHLVELYGKNKESAEK